MRRIAFYEDVTAKQLAPIATLRPVFELLCGHFSSRERLTHFFGSPNWGAIVRPELRDTYAEACPEARINDDQWIAEDSLLLINGRCLIDGKDLASLQPGTAAWIGETLAAVALPSGATIGVAEVLAGDHLPRLARTLKPIAIEGTVIEYPWDLISENPKRLKRDFETRYEGMGAGSLDPRVAIVGPDDQVFIHPTAKLDPFVVIDVSSGPVWIDADVQVQAFTRIEGPAFIGQKTQLFRANIREGCSFGPNCRLGGEIEESIVHGFANKYHDGFLGHSYVCSWVNLGALSTNSDLKNDYSDVSVPLVGTGIRTGSTKVGCFIGDHTKTAIGSLFNTGTSIGVMSLILPGGRLLPKHIPPFSRIWNGVLEELPDGTASAFQTARLAMARRSSEFTPAMERLLTNVFNETSEERARAIARASRS
jgi:UDP-N-acetylglucosamine diphosphorylase/glucosamine-1-phosphate N-acetyltransferase